MKLSVIRKMLVVGLLSGLASFSVQADLGLAQILSSEGVQAVGVAVKTAAEAIYASTDDDAVIQEKLTALVNEAVATGDTQAVRYAIVAVMMTGGAEDLALTKAAVDDSAAFDTFPKVTAITVSAVERILSGSGPVGNGEQGGEQGGGEQGGGEQGGGEQGGGDPGWWDLFELDIDDEDIDATRV